MKQWVTEFHALDARTGDMKTWGGPNISAPSWELAQQWCYDHAGHLVVVGELIAEIPCKKNNTPDFKNMVDYDIIHNN